MRNDSIAAARAAEQARTQAERDAQRREQERMTREMDEARRTLEAVVQFDYDEAVITAAAERLLRLKLPILRSSPTVRLRLEGHADERGSTEYNLALGSRRAESVREFLSGFGDFGRSVHDDLVRGRAACCQPDGRGGLGSEPSGRVRDHGRSDRDQRGRLRTAGTSSWGQDEYDPSLWHVSRAPAWLGPWGRGLFRYHDAAPLRRMCHEGGRAASPR